jgi:C-terminal processing protease CtpA/Prc
VSCVLTSSRAFSAGEGFAFLLQERHRAMVIGQRTAGAANPGQPYPVNALFRITIPNGRVRSAVGGGNWEGLGIIPDVEVRESETMKYAHAYALDQLIPLADGEWRLRLEQTRHALDVPARSR